MTHDGMWFYSCLQEYGIADANKMNKSAIRLLAGVEINRMLRACGASKEEINSYEKLRQFFDAASSLFIPDFMNVTWTFPGNGIVHWEFNSKNCFAFNGISKLGVIEQYECGVIYRVQCWLGELGIKHTVDPVITGCQMVQKGSCRGDIILNFG